MIAPVIRDIFFLVIISSNFLMLSRYEIRFILEI